MDKSSKEEECLLCKNKAELKPKLQKGYQDPTLFKIYHCASCDTSFSMPRVDSTNIYQFIYEKGDQVPGYNRYWRYYNEIKQQENPLEYLSQAEPIYWGISQALKNNNRITKESVILEMGSGLGYFTYSLRKDGFTNVYGMDIAQEAVDKANKELGPFYIQGDIYEYAKEKPAFYDVIYMSEVIEHIDNPITFIEAALSLLKDDGVLIMSTPNKSFYPSTAIWATDNPPVHCWWFSEDSMEYIAKNMGLSFSFIDFSDYYKKHDKALINKKRYIDYVNKRYIFDDKGELVRVRSARDIPKWNKIFKSLKRRFRSSVYPIFSKNYTTSGIRTTTLCVSFKKSK